MVTVAIEIVPASLDFTFVRGDDFSIVLTFSDENGDPIDMSDSTFRAQFRRKASASSSVAFTVDDSEAADGKVTLSLSSAVTGALLHTFLWDFERVFPDDAVQTLMAGEMKVLADVTRP